MARPVVKPAAETCFHEKDPSMPLTRRALVEGVGTLLLMLAATGASLVARRMGAGGTPLFLLYNALGISGALVGLVVAFGNASGGHFNPLITGLQWLAGERKTSCTVAYVAAQLTGGLLGAQLANVVFQSGIVLSAPADASSSLVLSEVVATAGLMIVIFGCSRSGLATTGPFAVGGWLMAAIMVMPSGSYANPAITVAALFADAPIALSPHTVPFYVLAEIGGALLALGVISIAYPLKPPVTSEGNGGGRLPAGDVDGLVTYASDHGEEKTTQLLTAAVARHGMEMIAQIDHAAAAAKSGLSLPYTRVLIFGNPKAGTPLMQASRTVGIDLPLKALVWRDDSGKVRVSHVDPRWLARHHGIERGTARQVGAMTTVLQAVMREASGTAQEKPS